jgi:hypothetical protein
VSVVSPPVRRKAAYPATAPTPGRSCTFQASYLPASCEAKTLADGDGTTCQGGPVRHFLRLHLLPSSERKKEARLKEGSYTNLGVNAC